MPEIQDVAFVSVFTTIGFLLYIQYSPTMGNIWIRDGHFTPRGAIDVMLYPFRERQMWKPKMWIINYPVWMMGGIAAIMLRNAFRQTQLLDLDIKPKHENVDETWSDDSSTNCS